MTSGWWPAANGGCRWPTSCGPTGCGRFVRACAALWPRNGSGAGPRREAAEDALCEAAPDLFRLATSKPADWFIAHTQTVLAVAARAARQCNSRLGFDCEDLLSETSHAPADAGARRRNRLPSRLRLYFGRLAGHGGAIASIVWRAASCRALQRVSPGHGWELETSAAAAGISGAAPALVGPDRRAGQGTGGGVGSGGAGRRRSRRFSCAVHR